MRGNRCQLLFTAIVIYAAYLEDYSYANKLFGKFGSVRVFLDPADAPSNSQWGSTWPEGIKLDENFQTTLASTQAFQDGSTLLQSTTQNSRRIASARRTYNWQAEELVISFNMTNTANPSCTRLQPPLKWLASSGAKLKVLHECSDSGAITHESKCSIVEVSVSRKFAEASLITLRNYGFGREDIYRMLDKGPWSLVFDISSALPRLFASLQNDLGLTRTQSVHIVSHCPYLIAQYSRYKGRDILDTASAFLDVGYTLPKLVAEITRFPSMLAAPSDRIRGWLSLLNGFGIAENPSLFGKMLKKAPFMLYVNAPQVTDDNFPERILSEDSTADSGFVAYGPLYVLQLLRAQNFPDLDKIVRSQPSILLVDSTELRARINFLSNLFSENMPSSSGKDVPAYAAGPVRGGSSRLTQPTDLDLRRYRVDRSSRHSAARLGAGSANSTHAEGGDRLVDLEDTTGIRAHGDRSHSSSYPYRTGYYPFSRSQTGRRINTFQAPLDDRGGRNNDAKAVAKSVLDRLDTFESPGNQKGINADSRSGGILEVSRNVTANSDREVAHQMLCTLLLSYPAVLSIEHRHMRAAGNALRTAGLLRRDVLLIARRHPPVLGRDPTLLINLLYFLRFTCGLRKVDLLPFLHRYPAVLGSNVKDIEPKVEYLFQSLGGSQDMLRRFPSFLSFDLEEHTRPRAEFLRALKIDPLINGLAFLVTAPANEIAHTAGVRTELFNQYHSAYSEMRRRKVLQELELTKSAASANGKEAKQKAFQFSTWMAHDSSLEETLLDEMDFSF